MERLGGAGLDVVINIRQCIGRGWHGAERLWQVHLTLTVANDAENAARTASREGGGAAAARQALEPQYRNRITKCTQGNTECGIQVTGSRVEIWIDVPIIVPGGSALGLGFKVHGEADLPQDF